MDSKKKSVLKSLSWRFTASLTTLAIVYLLSGEFKLAGAVMSIEVITKMIIYYFHERTWAKIEI